MISDIEPIGTLRRHVLGAVILDGSDDLHVIDGMPVYSAEIVNALIAENAAMKETLGYICNRSNEPEYHDCGMGCGLEDRGITDRYEAMYHGWESAMGRVYSEVIPDAMPETPATDNALAAVRAQAVEDAVKQVLSVDTIASTTVISYLLRAYANELREGASHEKQTC
ncbi:hypothetical protein [Serratia proteamaculans]|uniref:Uncharacterized protein n=1 Tax=Serratia proteamaculans TaxID=28151 RepID=A0A5Q2VJQ6_SERPR|nr:hypothetical protein [Serratia proteamaculans]QGH64179.1 hypothetical protein GHV41_26405 [Serratia proteamaculans]